MKPETTVELKQDDLQPFVVITYPDHQRRMTIEQAHAFVEKGMDDTCTGPACLPCKVSTLIAGIR